MNKFDLELMIINLLTAKIASTINGGDRDWNIQQGFPTPTPAELLEQSVLWDEDIFLADLLNLSCAACVEHLSLHEIDNETDLIHRSLFLDRYIGNNYASDLAMYYQICHDDGEAVDEVSDPTTNPFYYENGDYPLAA